MYISFPGERRFLQRKQASRKVVAGRGVEEWRVVDVEGEEGLSMVILLMICGGLVRVFWDSSTTLKPTISHYPLSKCRERGLNKERRGGMWWAHRKAGNGRLTTTKEERDGLNF